MTPEFFQIGTLPINMLTGIYDFRLVILSYLVAVFASYVALDLTGSLRGTNNTSLTSLLWLMGGAIAMGTGIWSMHFIGMLSFSIPGITLQYDIFWTLFSLIVAILASGFALYLLKKSVINVVHLIAGGIILGLGIASMHYTGMAAMLIKLNIRYLPNLFLLSIVVAIVASEAAIWLALKSNAVVLKLRNRIKFASAIIMGLAICGMHYTGMAASIFSLCATPNLSSAPTAINPTFLAMSIAAATFIILGIAFFASSYKEALNQQKFERARQLGMAEISASVLHNVGNVLNSMNVSAEAVLEKLSSSKLVGLEKLNELLNNNKNNLGDFINTQGEKIIEFTDKLAHYWRDEQKQLLHETNNLLQHALIIKNIISTQQSLSKTSEFEQVLSINHLLDEALLISGLDLKKEIRIEKHYQKIPPIRSDKVKLLQIFVNIVRNAKDALMETSKDDPLISLKTRLEKNQIQIEITDNGVGIVPLHLEKIFNYGFTTKETGHGFGLHSSAIAINNLGGTIRVESEGQDKGSRFLITLPYKPISLT